MTAEEVHVSFKLLMPGERRDLLLLARAAIATAFAHLEPQTPITLTPPLLEPTAAFVSLHCGSRLRGCVGTLAADKALHETVAHMARSAAFDDPRFPPLAEIELYAVDIEISRLGPLVPARPQDVQPGYHGVAVSRGEQRGVFLPQVASTYGWDRETLLREVCRKALLAPDEWQQPDCSLSVFVAEVFGEQAVTRNE